MIDFSINLMNSPSRSSEGADLDKVNLLDLFPPEIWWMFFEYADFMTQANLLQSYRDLWICDSLRNKLEQISPKCSSCGLSPIQARQRYYQLEQTVESWFRSDQFSNDNCSFIEDKSYDFLYPGFWLPVVTNSRQIEKCPCLYCREYTFNEIQSRLTNRSYILSLSSFSHRFSTDSEIIVAFRSGSKKWLIKLTQIPDSKELWAEGLTLTEDNELIPNSSYPANKWPDFFQLLCDQGYYPYDLTSLSTYIEYLEGSYTKLEFKN